MAGPTKLADISGIASPRQAPGTLRFSARLTSTFEQLRRASFPGGRSKEQGGTIVADRAGNLHLQNLGGISSTAGTIEWDFTIRDPAAFSLVGVFHTHPYDRTEGSMTGVSFSGQDFYALSADGYLLSVMQSGPRLFAILRTAAATPVPATRDADQTREIFERVDAGRTLQQASRIEAQQTAAQFGLAYYQGGRGVVTRV